MQLIPWRAIALAMSAAVALVIADTRYIAEPQRASCS